MRRRLKDMQTDIETDIGAIATALTSSTWVRQFFHSTGRHADASTLWAKGEDAKTLRAEFAQWLVQRNPPTSPELLVITFPPLRQPPPPRVCRSPEGGRLILMKPYTPAR